MNWRAFCLLFFVVSCARGASPHKEPVVFTHQAAVGLGNSVFVVGNHPDLGSWDVTKAVKLRYTADDIWTGEIAIQAGTQLQYKFIRRATDRTVWCNGTNVVDITPILVRSVPAQPPAPYEGKTIYYFSGWTSANLFYNSNGTWIAAAMARVGDGRSAGESLYKISGVGAAGETLEFVFNNGAGSWDNPPGGGNYLTNLDVIHVQSGHVFSYRPPATTPVPPIVTQFINSTATNIPDRNIRIYLPRGYYQNTTKRYPVLYLHDGQNVFDPGGPFGSWSADATATREMARGGIREAILVGVDNTDARIPEYLPPSDSYQSSTQGRADAYAHFLINNVRPYVDTTYRTLNDRANTLTLGSSMGGLVSLYLGREFNTFGKVGVVSPALWIAPNYVNTVAAGTKKPLRVYLDMGTLEGDTSSVWDSAQRMYDIHLSQQYAMNGDFWFVVGCAQGHNEPAWANRLPAMLRYLLPAREEPAELALRETPPKVAITTLNVPGKTAAFTYTSLFGFTYTLERTATFQDWTAVSTSAPESLPWANRAANDPAFPAGSAFFWRLRATPAP